MDELGKDTAALYSKTAAELYHLTNKSPKEMRGSTGHSDRQKLRQIEQK